MQRIASAIACASLALLAPVAWAQPCEPGWSGEFPTADLGGMSAEGAFLVPFDSGSGPELVVVGDFRYAGGFPARGLAPWNGQGYIGDVDLTVIDPNSSASVDCAALSPDGSALYVGGSLQAPGGGFSLLARWDGQAWTRVGGVPGRLYGMVALGGGTVYCVGTIAIDGVFYAVARLDESGWTGLAPRPVGFGDIRGVAYFDGGSGPALYVAGDFDTHDGAPGDHIAKWDGQSWSDVLGGLGGSGVDLLTGAEYLAAYGDSLYVGGDFTRAGDVSSGHIARLIGCNRCASDCDGNGFPALSDFLCFRNRFTAGDMAADFDGSGAIDLNDFIAFRNAYTAGCP